MKNIVVGVSRMTGVGKTSKQPYDMARCFVLSEIKAYEKDSLKIAGHGYEVAEVALDPAALAQFASVKFPAQLDLETDMQTRGGKLEPIVVGFKRVAAAA